MTLWNLPVPSYRRRRLKKLFLRLTRDLLNMEIDMRKMARKEGRRYCDPISLTYQAERMPEPIRLKVGPVPNTQAAVYEEFLIHICMCRLFSFFL